MNLVCEPSGPGLGHSAGRLSPRGQLVVGACLCAAATTFLYAVDPATHRVYPACWLYQTTGLYCAGCGATRALHALLHGQVWTALHDNVLFVALLPWILWQATVYARRAWLANRWPEIFVAPRTLARYGVGLIALALLFAVVRNLPGAPFDLLRPLAG